MNLYHQPRHYRLHAKKASPARHAVASSRHPGLDPRFSTHTNFTSRFSFIKMKNPFTRFTTNRSHKSKFRSRRQLAFFASLAILLVLAPIIYLSLTKPWQTKAAPWAATATNWHKRKQVSLVNNSGQTLIANTTYTITVNTKELVDAGHLQADCSDLRVFYQPNANTDSKLAYYFKHAAGATNCADSEATKVYFPLQANLSNNSTASEYYLYYDNPDATSESSVRAFDVGDKQALLVCPFNGDTECVNGDGAESPTTETGAIRYSGGKSALSFDGTSSDKVTGVNIGNIWTDSFTGEAWINTSEKCETGDQFYMDVFNNNGDSNFTVYCQSNSFRLWFWNTLSPTSVDYKAIVNLTPNTWHHIAYVFNPSTKSVKFYFDGTEPANYTHQVQGDGTLPSSFTYKIGERSGSYFQGLIDEVRISNTARYTSNFTPQTTPFVRDEYTKLLLHFDENGDDPRNTGKAIDDSGNGNHGTITGAKYVSGLVGVDASATDTGKAPSQSYAAHEGIFIEEGTTNKITNPSFEHTTYDTNWSAGGNSFETFTQGSQSLAKRNAPGPFAAAPIVQGDPANANSLSDDLLSFRREKQIGGNFYHNFDTTQGSVVLWWTPEYSYNALSASGLHYIWYVNANYYLAYNYANDRYEQRIGGQTVNISANIVAGTTYSLITNWDTKAPLLGSNYQCFTIDDGTPTCGTTQPTASAPASNIYIGSNDTTGGGSGIIEGLTVYRRPLFDGTNGIDMGNGDEINLTAGTTDRDPTLSTGSWDVVFALPTNSSVGAMTSGTGEAWSHPHASNLLGGTNGAAGFMLNGTYTSDGFADEGTPTSVTALSASEKIYGGGYKVTSDAANEGIYKDITVTAGQDFVIRGLAHSDGTAVPKLILYDQTNGAEIGSLTGTTTSTRTAPNMLLFTGEAPDGKARGWIGMTGQPADGQTVTIDTQTYIFKTSLTGTPGAGEAWVLIGAAYTNTADNLRRAITNAGTLNTNYKYGTGVTAHTVVTATVSGGDVTLTALSAGTSGNVTLSETADNTTVSGANLTGGQTATTTVRVKLINTASSGTTYWHQVEVLGNKISNPSFETGAGDPWIPTGWSQYAYDLGELIQNTSDKSSGYSSIQIYGNAQLGNWNSLYYDFPDVAGNFYSSGMWGKKISDNSLVRSGIAESVSGTIVVNIYPTTSTWAHITKTGRVPTATYEFYLGLQNGLYNSIIDDVYIVELENKNLIVSPAPSSTSTESNQLRVDGKDTYTHTLPSLTATSGTVNFSYTPRHSAADVAKFGETTPYIAKLMSGATDYIALYWSAANTLRLEYQMNGGTVTNATWNATGAITAGTNYAMQITYTGGGSMVLSVDGTPRITLSSIPGTFADAPAIAYWGSNSNGSSQGDATIVPQIVTATKNTTAPYSKFATSSAQLVNASGDGRGYITSLNPGNTNTHTLSAYVYDGTTGNVGGAVSATEAKLVFNGSVVTPSAYTDMGGGWWRLTYSAATTNSAGDYGVQALSGKTIYVDGVQLEEKAYATTYADGSSGSGYSWTGTENESSSARAVGLLRYSRTNNFNTTSGTAIFWFKNSPAKNGQTSESGISSQLLYSENDQFGIRARYFNSTAADVRFGVRESDGSYAQVSSAANIVPLGWNFIRVSWGNSQIKLSVNGGPTATGAWDNTMYSATSIYVQGADSAGGVGGVTKDLSLFDTELTDSEVASLYYSGLGSHEMQTDFTEQFSGQEEPTIYWKFDEGFGEIAYDSSQTGNNGVIDGATWSDDTFGSAPEGKSLQFDGVDDHVYKAYAVDIELDPVKLPFSTSVWFKAPSSVTAQQTLIARYAGSGYKVYMNASGQMCFGIDDDSTWGPDDAACSTQSFADSNWHLVTAIKGDSTISLYVDAVQVATTAITATGGLSGSSPTFYVGIDSDGTSNSWRGFLDEVRTYSYALSTEQILTEYSARGSVKGVSAAFTGEGAEGALGQGLVGYWKMDEASWNGTAGEVIDSSGNGNHGVRSGDATTAVGKYSKGGTFDGTGDYVTIGQSTSLHISDEFTFSAWVKTSNSTNTLPIIGKGNIAAIGTTGKYIFGIYQGKVWGVYRSLTGTTISTNQVSDNNWHYITWVYSKKNNQNIVYINGNFDGQGNVSSIETTQDNSDVQLGSGNMLGYNYLYNGRVDELRVYNRALSPAEVQALYNWAPKPRVHLKMDEGGGETANDSSGNNRPGTLNNNATWDIGKFGQGIKLDGTGDSVSVPSF